MTSGGCEILHADCIEVLQTLAENSFDALITDPPYSSGGQYRGDRMQSVTEKYSQSGAKAEYLKPARLDQLDGVLAGALPQGGETGRRGGDLHRLASAACPL
mgnify:CR=1 FL=1